MNKDIKKLDKEIVKLISAGEVIESPSGVVKELIENSIDAGAKNIIAEIKNGGKTYIRISDDGQGIKKDQISIAFEKNSTSKISNFDDFQNVSTNGFRGEALFSISAVSKVSIITKTIDDKLGTKAEFEQNQMISYEMVGANDGTTIICTDLFYNTPARKKFLKTDIAEGRKITDYLIKYAISRPDISFKYINNDKVIFQTYGSGIKDTISILFNKEYDNGLHFYEESIDSNIEFRGALGDNNILLPSRRGELIFINGRIIENDILIKTIENAYRSFVPKGNFPVFFINLVITPKYLDVNIHPNKLNIKFSQDLDIYGLLERFIREKISKIIMIPSITESKSNTEVVENFQFDKIRNIIENKSQKIEYINNNEEIPNRFLAKEESAIYNPSPIKIDYTNTTNRKNIANTKGVQEKEEIINKNEYITNEKFIDLNYYKYIGRLFNTYILLSYEDKAILIDQHAAHERILFEKFLSQYKDKKINIQNLLIPIKKNIPFQLIENTSELISILNKSGFSSEMFGDNILLIRGIPQIFDENEAANYTENILEIFTDKTTKDNTFYDRIAEKACKAAIKGGQLNLKENEINALIMDLNNCENKFACPHGRPIIIEIKKYEVEKMFKRVI